MGTPPAPSVLTVTQDAGRLLAVRTATEPDDRARLRHEAAVLTRFDHPGVVRFVDHAEGPPATLRTVFVGPDTWHDRPPAGAEVIPALSALGATLADLHEAGLAHGRVEPDHVLVGPQGRPVLCGLGDARPLSPSASASDLAAFAALGRSLTPRSGDDGPLVHDLLDALEAGRDDLRGTVRGLDRRRVPSVSAPHRRPPPRMLLGIVALTAVFAAITVLAAGPPRSPSTRPAATTTTGDTLSEPLPTTTLPAPPPTPPATSAPGALEIAHGGRRYALGQPGDQVVVGDWDCDGTPPPALLRPPPGEVLVFHAWPDAGASIEPSTRATVDGARSLTAGPAACPELRATTATGSRLIITPES